MAYPIQPSPTASSATPSVDEHSGKRLGAFLCWAVVFADIGTSIYYVPGILYGQVNRLAGLFVLLTMLVFLLLVLKYAEVSVRFPEGGGVVTVSARALHPWAGAVGGMFILVDYFLTASISSLSGLQYFAALVPQVTPFVTVGAIGVLIFLAVLNWWGIKESATFSAVIAVAALVSDLLIILLIFLNYTPAELVLVVRKMFSGSTQLTGLTFLTGFAGAFLAFSGLESISQLSPVMRVPRSKTVTRALGLVVLTIGITSPLLTIFATILLTTPLNAAHGIPAPYNTLPLNQDQLISELGRAYGGRALELATAVSGSVLLLFASNTAIIGAYHVFLALSRMRFFPTVLQWTGAFRGTPHVAIFLAAGIPMLVLIAVRGSIEVLGNLYAFGLLGAFILTCVSLDVIRWRERHSGVLIGAHEDPELQGHGQHRQQGQDGPPSEPARHSSGALGWARARQHVLHLPKALPVDQQERLGQVRRTLAAQRAHVVHQVDPFRTALRKAWPDIRYYLGFPTTLLVAIAWVTNLFSKPDATVFGGGLTLLGVGIAVVNYRLQQRAGEIPVFPMTLLHPIPRSILVALPASSRNAHAVVRAAVERANGHPLVFVYLAEHGVEAAHPQAFQFADPYLYDVTAQRLFSRAATQCHRAGVSASFVYRVGGLDQLLDVWRVLRPDEIMVEAGATKSLARFVAPDYVRFTVVDGIHVAHYVRHHLSPDEGSRAAELSSSLRAAPMTSTPTPPPAPARVRVEPPSRTHDRLSEAVHQPPSPSPQSSSMNGASPAEAEAAASRQGADLDEWVWTGTDLVRREQVPNDGTSNDSQGDASD